MIKNVWKTDFKFQGCHVVGIFTKETFFFDRIAETMNVPPDHTFGACLRPEDYGKYTVSFKKANKDKILHPPNYAVRFTISFSQRFQF